MRCARRNSGVFSSLLHELKARSPGTRTKSIWSDSDCNASSHFLTLEHAMTGQRTKRIIAVAHPHISEPNDQANTPTC